MNDFQGDTVIKNPPVNVLTITQIIGTKSEVVTKTDPPLNPPEAPL
jgi:hypothetical protein